MTFVYPLLLGGLLLAGLPVLLHFLIRQKPKTLLFPAFRFLVQKQRSNTRNLRLRHLLLLLLRVALLLLICFALARPRLFHEAIGISREKPVAMILVFDTSPSMGYKSGDTTRLDLAKQRCIELLNELPDDGRVLLLDASDPASFAREDWLKSLEKARQRVSTLAIRPDNAPVTKALAEAWRRFDELDRSSDDPDAPNMPRFVCVYFDVGLDEPIDLAILQAALPANRQSFTEGETIRLRVLVKATGKDATNTLILNVDGKVRATQAFNAEAGKPQTLTLDLDTTGLGIGVHHAEAKFENADGLPFNDVRFLTFEIRTKQKILVLADDERKAQKFKWALDDLGYDAKLTAASAKPDFAGYQAIFLVGVAAPTETLWKALADYVQQGNGVGIIPPGEDIVESTYRSSAAKKVMPAEIVRKIESAGAVWSDNLSPLNHPFMLPYRRWLAQGEYEFLQRPRRAFAYWEVKPFDETNIAVPTIYEQTKQPAVVVRTSVGKVLLLTTTMDERKPAWNDYDEKLTSFYIALTMMCAKHLCPEPASVKLNYQFGQAPPLVKKETALLFKEYVLSSGDFSEEIRFDDKGRWVGERLPRQGNYTITGTNGDRSEPTHKFSVNVASEESDLARVPIAEIEALLGKDALVPQDRKRSLIDTLNWNEPMELFPWLMILLLFMLALENLLANRFYRQEPADPNAS